LGGIGGSENKIAGLVGIRARLDFSISADALDRSLRSSRINGRCSPPPGLVTGARPHPGMGVERMDGVCLIIALGFLRVDVIRS